MQLLNLRKGKFHVDVFDSIDEVEISRPFFEVFPVKYFGIIESTAQNDLRIRYLIVKNEKGIPVCFLYFQILSFSSENVRFSGNTIKRFLISCFLRFRPFKILISGNLFAVNFPAIGYDSSEISIDEIIEIIFEFENVIKCDVLIIKDLATSFTKEIMLSKGFQKYESDLTMSMNIRSEWKTIADYFAALKKKYRRRAEKIRHSGNDVIRKELNIDELHKQSKIINQLFQNVVLRQQIKMGQVKPNYFTAYKEKYPDNFSLVGYYIDEKMVAFVTYVDHGETLEVHYIGIDYEINNSRNLYFNILFDSLERAIEKNKKHLELGRTAREAKAMLGAEAIYFNDYIMYKSRLANRVSANIARQFNLAIGESWANRTPLK